MERGGGLWNPMASVRRSKARSEIRSTRLRGVQEAKGAGYSEAHGLSFMCDAERETRYVIVRDTVFECTYWQ
jgi:hypothetical protein